MTYHLLVWCEVAEEWHVADSVEASSKEDAERILRAWNPGLCSESVIEVVADSNLTGREKLPKLVFDYGTCFAGIA